MSISVHRAEHRDDATTSSWLSVAHASTAGDGGRHRHGEHAPPREALAPLLRRASAAIVVWLAVFGLFAIAEGWSSVATIALAIAVLSLLGLAFHHGVTAALHSASNSKARSAGVNPRRNGYGRKA